MPGSSAVAYCGQQLIGVSIASAFIQIIVVGARFYTRYLQQTAYRLDDFLIVLALIASLGQTALYLYLIPRGGIGYHLGYVEQTPQKLVILDKGLYANEILDFPFTVTPAKISILLFYSRIFTLRSFEPLRGTVASILRMTTFFLESATIDPTWTSVELGIWTILESGIIIISACLPTIWSLASRFTSTGLLTIFYSKQMRRQQYHEHANNSNAGPGLAHHVESAERIADQSQFEETESDGYAESLTLNEIQRGHNP